MKELILDVKFGDPQHKNLRIPKISSAKLANRKKKFYNLHHILHQDSRANIGANCKKAELNLFSKSFAACFSVSVTTIFSSLRVSV